MHFKKPGLIFWTTTITVLRSSKWVLTKGQTLVQPRECATMQDKLDTVSLLSFLDAYPEPAFILCSNPSPQQSLKFVYGNLGLRSLILGPGSPPVLDDSTFFESLSKESDLHWLHDPTCPAPGATSKVGYIHTVEFRPAWIPSTHTLDMLELTATPITLPITIPGARSSGRSFVFTASPSKHTTQIARDTFTDDVKSQPPTPFSSFESTSPSSSTSAGSAAGLKSGSPVPQSRDLLLVASKELTPSRMIDTFPWDKTPLGPREQWPSSLTTMAQYVMAKQVPVCITYSRRAPFDRYLPSRRRCIGAGLSKYYKTSTVSSSYRSPALS